MYSTNWYAKLLRRLKEEDSDNELRGREALLLQVELGIRLLELLDLRDEPLTVLWVLLSGLPIPDSRLLALDTSQKRMVANARMLLPFHSRFGWEDTLREYAAIPRHWRAYRVQGQHLERQLVDNARRLGQHDERMDVYDDHLQSELAFSCRSVKEAKLGQTVNFMLNAAEGRVEVPVLLPETLAPVTDLPTPAFSDQRLRRPLAVSFQELRAAAIELDKQETEPNWVARLERYIRHRAIQPDGSLSDVNAVPLQFDGMTHLVGMVGSGKSTLMSLLAAHAVLETEWRVTLIVNDTMTALGMAEQFNRLLGSNGEKPVAVALLGRTTRDKHLTELHNTRDFHEEHIGLRWLSVVCPLQGFVAAEHMPEPIPIGREPCERLLEPEKPGKATRNYLCCPLFSVCPMQQVYRDMPDARIWITTPGALGAARVPLQADERRIRLGDLVYEQSDIVVFDEVDTVQEWFDNLLAPEVQLFDPQGTGILDRTDVSVAETGIQNRTPAAPDRRWRTAERHAVDAGSNILSQLDQIQMLPRWIQRNYFSALSLFFKLSRRLMGLPDYSRRDDDATKVDKARKLFDIFKSLTADDFLGMKRPPSGYGDPVYRLALIAMQLVAQGDTTQNTDIVDECEEWIREFVPDIDRTVAELHAEREKWNADRRRSPRPPKKPRPDSLQTLAQRLEFALNVAILDRNLRVVFYEWERNEAVDLPQPRHRAPQHLTRLLPVPPTGQLFGSYFSRDVGQLSEDSDDRARSGTGRLSVFAYNNLGRWYVRHFHELRRSLDGKPGPHVLAMSGTSWLPDSSRWHFEAYGALPQGVLQPADHIMKAIEQSKFVFLPQYEENDRGELKPLRVSGILDKGTQIRKIVRRLMGAGEGPAPLKGLLAELGAKEGEHWKDRARILLLVNSYEQAEVAARELIQSSSDFGEHVYALVRSEGADEEEILAAATLERLNVERFTETGGKILVAPMQAISRGYNILNEARIAAFGAVCFLTRPMPHPYDTQAIVRELNHKTLVWCEDADFPAWHEGSLYEKGLALRRAASARWRRVEERSYYSQLDEEERLDLAATTAGLIIQACGRLLRGGVPFYAYFVDAAWAPHSAAHEGPDTPRTSLLAAIIQVLQQYAADPVGQALYDPLYLALTDTQNFDYTF